jgi:hypothetical protein
MRHTIPAFLVVSLAACTWSEDFTHFDLKGTVRLPKEAAMFPYIDDAGAEHDIPDPRAIGPVYLGAFPSVQEGLFAYPHPEMGPIITTTQPGDTYPYGGGTVGRMAWGCYQSTVCRVVTGRFSGFGDMIDFYNNVLGPYDGDANALEITDYTGAVVTSDEVYRQRCYDFLYYTSDAEVEFIPPDQSDSAIADYLDFHEETDDDGDFYVADVELLHVKMVEGMQIWGWVDMPTNNFNFNSCDPTNQGRFANQYNDYYPMGATFGNVLNFPSQYIDPGDWVVDDAPSIDDPEKEFTVTLGYHYAG